MAFFRRRSGDGTSDGTTGRWGFGRSRQDSAGPALDPACGDEELALLLKHAASGDWESLRDGLAAVADQADRTWMLAMVAEVAGIEEWIPKAVEAEPDSALPLLLSGARQVSWAWEARSAAYAKYVTEDQWKLFHERLKVAEEQLFEVAEREPGWLGPWYFLQISGRGESIDREAGRYRFEAALRRYPEHLGSHKQRLQQLCAKWSGSHEEMHDFARTSMLSAPEGSPLGELVALAHIEHWLALDDSDARVHMNSQAVRDQLNEAADRSIRHPAYQRPRGWKTAYNTFAMAFWLAGQPAAANLLFRELGGTVTESPWHYLSGGPVQAFRKAQAASAR